MYSALDCFIATAVCGDSHKLDIFMKFRDEILNQGNKKLARLGRAILAVELLNWALESVQSEKKKV
jgi:hypothetical protein